MKIQIITTEVVKSYPNIYKNFAITQQAFQNCAKKAEAFSNEYFKLDQAQNPVKVENLEYNIVDNDEETGGQSSPSAVLEYPTYQVEPTVHQTILLVYIKNTNNSDYNVKVKVTPAEGNTNLRAPLNVVEDVITKNRFELWMVCHKVDPTKDWGDYSVSWEVQEKPQEQNFYSSSYGISNDYDMDNNTGFAYVDFGQLTNFYA